MKRLTIRILRRLRRGLALCLCFAALTMGFPLAPNAASAASQAPIQVFDVQKEQVVATLPNSPAFREQADHWLRAVRRLSERSRIEAETGIVVHIPLDPPLPVSHKWLSFQAAEIYLFVDPQEKESPHLLVFSSEGKPYVFDCPEKPDLFLQQHGLQVYMK
ncbi:hypothetical protein N0M98_16600 [Paenibacillus doosanensis]|uniref:Uncharacterized protein n=1 Tax=Paenibacillus konkukensis TaxID=2020716 RepID=A0ABY4RMK1_9BACL|nr:MULTISPECIES: hypothetical protein [Paenibacillus]MCS7461776.1 hypothetical protein [Paenibacillus doosanensis]UQZ83616.1 hypothetical protein SK3146_02803 [Paenibacillus konkukensis]